MSQISNTNSKPKSIVVFVSGNGSNLQALINAINSGYLLNVYVSYVVSSSHKAYALQRLTNTNIKSKVFNKKEYATNKLKYEQDLADFVLKVKPDLIVLAGWMYILSKTFLDLTKAIQIINLHPALPKTFDGKNAIERAYNAYKQKKIESTGVMVHYVIEQVDKGEPIITQEIFFKDLTKDQVENLDEFTKKVHEVEHILIVKAVKIVLNL